MDGVGISIIERPRPLPGHDTPNPTHHTYTLKCEEPLNYEDRQSSSHTTTVQAHRAAEPLLNGRSRLNAHKARTSRALWTV